MESTYQKIADIILEMDLGDWKRIVCYFQYTDSSFEIALYVKGADDKYLYYLDLNNDPNEWEELIMDLDDIIVEHRKEMEKQNGKWSIMTFIIEDNGYCKAEYDYNTDLETSMGSKKDWKNKYLI